jgi:hypothetical protein
LSKTGAAYTTGVTAAGSGSAFRVMGYNVPWSAILGVALVSGIGAYAYETKKVADVDRKKSNGNACLIFLLKQTHCYPYLKYS